MSERLRELTHIPDGAELEASFERAEVVVIGGHSDDVEILGLPQIIECEAQRSFFGICVTEGTDCPRTGPYAELLPEQVQRVRREEQKEAANAGHYSGVSLLQYSSQEVRDPQREDVADDLLLLLEAIRPKVVITHNLFDRHPTHIGVAMRVIEALRGLSGEYVPEQFLGMEVWNSLDWILPEMKVGVDASAALPRAEALLSVFDSQISGGKAYQNAVPARWTANATFACYDEVDETNALSFGVDMKSLIRDVSVQEYVDEYLQRFYQGILSRIALSAPSEIQTLDKQVTPTA